MKPMSAKAGDTVYVIEDFEVTCTSVRSAYPSRCYVGEACLPFHWGDVYTTRREALEALGAKAREIVAEVDAELNSTPPPRGREAVAMAKPLDWREFTVPQMKADRDATEIANALTTSAITGTTVVVQIDGARWTLSPSVAESLARAIRQGMGEEGS